MVYVPVITNPAPGLAVFAHAIRTQESGGNYTAYNGGSGASGAYQFTHSTWIGTMTAAGQLAAFGIYVNAYEAPPEVQDYFAEWQMNQYYRAFGSSWFNVAEAWYGGPGAVGHPDIGGGPGYPNVGQYANDVIALYNSYGGVGGNAGGGGGVIVAPPPTPSATLNEQYQGGLNNMLAVVGTYLAGLYHAWVRLEELTRR